MKITLSPQEYATAFRLLSSTSRHPINIAQGIKERVVPRLPKEPSLLDVGAGPGTIALELAPFFKSITLIEPNRDQLASFSLEGAEIINDAFENFKTTKRYDLVLCSHMMYHVPLPEWGSFVNRLIEHVRPGGYCAVVLGAARGQNYLMHRDFTDLVIDSSLLIKTLNEKGISFEVVPSVNAYTATTFDDIVTLCRFFVLEDCFTAEQRAALTEEGARALDEKIRAHAERCRLLDGTYRLEQDDDMILLEKQAR